MRNVFRRVWLWVVAGHFGNGQWWTVPLAIATGIPLYANMTGIVPVMESLMKGLPAGTVLAFCLATAAASLPEILMLKQVMRPGCWHFFREHCSSCSP